MNQAWWMSSYAPDFKTFNKKALNMAKVILPLLSLLCISLFQFQPHYSPEFKVFLNLFWYPCFNIGLTFSGIMIGFDYYTNEQIRWKEWVANHRRFYASYYFYAVIVIIVGLIALAIVQATNPEFQKNHLVAPITEGNFLSQSNYGWTDNPSNWYGFLILYSLVPTQNFYVLGTVFVATLFFFILVGPFIYNWMNRISFSACTTFVCTLLVLALFLSTWSETFFFNPYFRQDLPWFNYVNLFTNWFLIAFMFILGFYIRKYMKAIPWRIATVCFVGLSIIFFVAETTLDFTLQDFGTDLNQPNKFNTFYIGSGICSLPILLLSYLAVNVFSSYKSSKTQVSKVFVMFDYFHEHSLKLILDQFLLSGLLIRMTLGVLVYGIFLNQNIQLSTNEIVDVSKAVDASVWGWIVLGVTILNTIAIYGVYEIKILFFDAVIKTWQKHQNKKQLSAV